MTEDHNAKSLSFAFTLMSSNAEAFFLSIVTPLELEDQGALDSEDVRELA
jgi:hypothetical protein